MEKPLAKKSTLEIEPSVSFALALTVMGPGTENVDWSDGADNDTLGGLLFNVRAACSQLKLATYPPDGLESRTRVSTCGPASSTILFLSTVCQFCQPAVFGSTHEPVLS